MKQLNTLISAIAVVLLIAPAGFGFAQTSDLGESGGLLPSNPFYFLKEFGRGVRKLFVFNPVGKAELELNVLSEKAAELKKLDEIAPEKVDGLIAAAENYKRAAEELRARLESLSETSENPNVDRLLSDLAQRSLRHQQLFDELQLKFESEDLRKDLDEAKEKLSEAVASASQKLDTPEKLRLRFESAIENNTDEFKELRAAEFADRLEGKTSGEIKREIGILKDDLLIKFSGRLQGLELTSPASAPSVIDRISGDQARYLKILDEVREKIVNPDIKSQLNVVRQRLLESAAEDASIGEEEALRAIDSAEKLIAEVEALIKNRAAVSISVKELLARAKFNLTQANQLFSEGNFRGAFGQATAAYAAAKNAWSQLTPTETDNSQVLESLKIYYDALTKKAVAAGLTRENNPKAFSLLSDAERKILELAKLIAAKAAPETIAAAARAIKLNLATVDELLVSTLKPVIEFTPPPSGQIAPPQNLVAPATEVKSNQ